MRDQPTLHGVKLDIVGRIVWKRTNLKGEFPARVGPQISDLRVHASDTGNKWYICVILLLTSPDTGTEVTKVNYKYISNCKARSTKYSKGRYVHVACGTVRVRVKCIDPLHAPFVTHHYINHCSTTMCRTLFDLRTCTQSKRCL